MSTSESIGRTYPGIEEMGLFWSMVKQGNSYSRASLINGSRQLPYKFNVYEGHQKENENDKINKNKILASSEITRYLVDENVTRLTINEGDVKGTLLIPEGDGPFPAIINVLGGLKKGNVL